VAGEKKIAAAQRGPRRFHFLRLRSNEAYFAFASDDF
jgi:hypothetical protein